MEGSEPLLQEETLRRLKRVLRTFQEVSGSRDAAVRFARTVPHDEERRSN
jgi:hypothetical protein